MILRISLVIAIFAGLVATLLSQFVLRSQIEQGIQQRNVMACERARQADLRLKAEAALDGIRKERDTALAKGSETDQQRTVALNELQSKRQKLAQAEQNLAMLRAAKLELEQFLASWRAIGLTTEEVVRIRDTWKAALKENEKLASLNKDLRNELQGFQATLAALLPSSDPLMPAELRGRVTLVDPRWGFVVLNVGREAGVRPNGVLLAGRNGQFVAQLRVTRVEASRSVAEVVRETQQGEVFEGDSVIARVPIPALAVAPDR